MSAATHNFTIDQGSDWYATFVYTDSAGVAIDLTGYTAALQIRDTYADSTTDLSLTTSSGITITAATGTLVVHATAAQTTAIAAGQYVYDLEITSATSIVTRLVQGKISISPQVTR